MDSYIGKIYGRLTIIEEPFSKNGFRYVKCMCSCSSRNIVTKKLTYLINKHVKSCGCLSKRRTALVFKQAKKNYKQQEI